MTLEISPELAQLVQQQMATGHYESENDLIRSALSLLAERQRQLDELRREIQPALDRLDRGEGRVLDAEAIKAEGRRRLSQGEGVE